MKHLATLTILTIFAITLSACNNPAKHSPEGSVVGAKMTRASDRTDKRTDELVDRSVDKIFGKIFDRF